MQISLHDYSVFGGTETEWNKNFTVTAEMFKYLWVNKYASEVDK